MQRKFEDRTNRLRLYSAWYCPFAQRTWMTLLLKGIEFEYIEVDPYEESAWWLAVSRHSAKVPVIVAQNETESEETTVIDSTRTVEYLDDLVPATHPLLPGDPNERAELRHWADHVNRVVAPFFYRYLQANEEGEYRDSCREKLLSGLHQLGTAMSATGPYFSGAQVSIVDILLIPFAYRIETLLGHYREFSVPKAGDVWQRYNDWYQTMSGESYFKLTSTDHEGYRQRLIDFYHPYSQGGGQKDVAQIS